MSNKSIIGIESLLKKLEKMGGNVEKVMVKSIGKQTKLVLGEAKLLAPVDTGDLRNSIKSNVKKSNNGVVGTVSTNSDHSAYVEFGTGQKGIKSPSPPKYDGNISYTAEWSGMPARPYLYPALKNNEKKILKNIQEDIKEEIKKVAKS